MNGWCDVFRTLRLFHCPSPPTWHPIVHIALFLSMEESVLYFIALNSRHKYTLINIGGTKKNPRLSVPRPGLEFQLHYILLIFLSLSFIICK